MHAWWNKLLAVLTRLDLSFLWDWPHWGHLGAGLCLLLMGGVLGYVLARRRRNGLGAPDVLAALERVVRGDRVGAFKILQEAADSPDAPAEVYLALASLLRAMGHASRSAHIHRALTLRADLDDVLRTRAVIGLAADFLTLGQSERAEQLLSELPRKLRRQDALLALRRNAAIRAGDWKEALAAGGLLARRSGQGSEAVSDIYGRMADAALARQDDSEAISSFKRALSNDAGNVHAAEGLARLYLAEEKYYRARRLLERAIDQAPDAAPRLLPMLRVAVRSRDRYRSYLQGLVEEGVASPWADLELAELAYAEEEIDDAHVILADLMEVYPQSIDVREAYLNLLIAIADERTIFAEMDRFMALSGEVIERFRCSGCGHRSPASFVACAACGAYGTVTYCC